MLSELSSAISSRTKTNPRTVLAFVGTVLVAVAVAAVTTIGILARAAELRWLVPWVLVSLLVLVAGVLIAVLRIAWTDPSRLMLGQVTGTEYAEIRRVQLGDSVTGFHEEAVPVGGTRAAIALSTGEEVQEVEQAEDVS